MLELLRHSLKFTMLQPFPVSPVPPDTMRVARAALRIQNSCLQLRDPLGTVFDNEMFAPLFPERGQPAAAPWRLVLVTILQFSEGLSDRDAADAVRSRIDWKYLLGLEILAIPVLITPSCPASGIASSKAEQRCRCCKKLLEKCKESNLIHRRSDMRTDATHVVAFIRKMNRSELVGETLRAALNALAAVDPILAVGQRRHFLVLEICATLRLSARDAVKRSNHCPRRRYRQRRNGFAEENLVGRSAILSAQPSGGRNSASMLDRAVLDRPWRGSLASCRTFFPLRWFASTRHTTSTPVTE